MSGDETTEVESEDETTRTDTTVKTETETETETEPETTLDIEAAAEQEASIEALQNTVEEQGDRIEELEDLVLDLSARVASGDATGVCPDCHGPVIKSNPFFRSAKIKCSDCGRVFHDY